jgi:hypothetical protein
MITTRSHTKSTRRAIALSATVLSTLLNTVAADAQQAPRSVGCGFRHVNPDHHNGATALYTHCADSFILIRVDTADGSYHTCVGPWGSIPFFASGRVNNAYYVPIRPRLLTGSDGRQICSVTQPPV